MSPPEVGCQRIELPQAEFHPLPSETSLAVALLAGVLVAAVLLVPRVEVSEMAGSVRVSLPGFSRWPGIYNELSREQRAELWGLCWTASSAGRCVEKGV